MFKKSQNFQSNTSAANTRDDYTLGNGLCEKCGKPFIYIGDTPYGGFIKGTEPYCTCGVKKQMASMYGWICPKCGAGLSPLTTMCPCSIPKWDITY
jgi:ssDNA-binding Zn-finger/Zn-ribbon topoisomerase 1